MFNRPVRLGVMVLREYPLPSAIILGLAISAILVIVVWKLVKVIKRWKRKRDLRAYYQKVKSKKKTKK